MLQHIQAGLREAAQGSQAVLHAFHSDRHEILQNFLVCSSRGITQSSLVPIDPSKPRMEIFFNEPHMMFPDSCHQTTSTTPNESLNGERCCASGDYSFVEAVSL